MFLVILQFPIVRSEQEVMVVIGAPDLLGQISGKTEVSWTMG